MTSHSFALHRRSRLAVWWLATTLFGAPSALASPNYPAILDSHAGVECPRPLTRCLICHVTAAGGEGTAKKPFAEMLVEVYQLEGKSGRDLAAMLDEIPPELDTDGDGVPDQEELSACGNPSGEELSEGPGFGCAVVNRRLHGPSERALSTASGLAARATVSLLFALGLVRRRRGTAAGSRARLRGEPPAH